MAVGKQIQLNAGVISHIGCVRKNNEDNFYFDGDYMLPAETDAGARFEVSLSRPWHLIAVCDGMGGLEGGENASGIAAQQITQLDREIERTALSDEINACLRGINKMIIEDGKQKAGAAGKPSKEGTTVVLAYISGANVHIANIGDSRAYVLREGELYQLSEDHSPLYREMLAGRITREQMRKDPHGNAIEHYLGQEEDRTQSDDYIKHHAFMPCRGDRLLLCSDGLSDLITHEEIRDTLSGQTTPGECAAVLIRRALEMAGKDNTTAIVADLTDDSLPLPYEDLKNELLNGRYAEDDTTDD